MKTVILLLLMIVLCWGAFAQERFCSESEAIEAENSNSRLNNWEDIYKSFKRFRYCDDGAIAEGYSDTIVRMFADQWNTLEAFIKLSSSDKDFYTFVLRHIDSTTDKTDVEKIIINSSKRCHELASAMCSTIEKTARKVLLEF